MKYAFFLLLLSSLNAPAQEIERRSLPKPPDVTRSEVLIVKTSSHPNAILVLCPGMNGTGEDLARDRQWRNFAADNNLALWVLSFASKPSDLYAERGYTFPDQGSGDALMRAVRDEYGSDIPLVLYGFSSGAYFVELFVAWKPHSVRAWAAHATGRFEDHPEQFPPGIVSCGNEDYERLGPSLTHFKKCRTAGNSLLWVGIPNLGHGRSPQLEDFIRYYFSAVLSERKNAEEAWVDIETEQTLSPDEALKQPTLSAWLPDKRLLQSWREINSP